MSIATLIPLDQLMRAGKAAGRTILRSGIIPLILLLALLSTAGAQETGDDTTGTVPDTTAGTTPIDSTRSARSDTTNGLPDTSITIAPEDTVEDSSPLGRSDTLDTVNPDPVNEEITTDTTAALPRSDSTEEASLTDTGNVESMDDMVEEDAGDEIDEAELSPSDTDETETPLDRDNPLDDHPRDDNPLGRSTPRDSTSSRAVSQHSPESPRNNGTAAAEDGGEGGGNNGRRPDGTTASREGTGTNRDAGMSDTPLRNSSEGNSMSGLRPVGDEMTGLEPLEAMPLEHFEIEDESSIEPRFEVTPWIGATWFREGGHPWAGLRFMEIAFWPTEKTRLWVQYDNGLSFDNLLVARSTETTPALYVGGFFNYEENHTSRAELGLRTLPGNISQLLLRTEQVLAFSDGHSLKGGLWLGPRSDGRVEWIMHLGGGVPVSRSIRLDPTFFYSRSGEPGQKEWRLLVSGEYMLSNRVKVAAGIAGGVLELWNGWKQGVAEEFLKVTAQIEDFYQLHALFKNETVGARRGITVIAAGFTWGFGGR